MAKVIISPLCTTSRRVCGVPTPHAHCDCGIAIPPGRGFCNMCMGELMRGANMRPTSVVTADGRPASGRQPRKTERNSPICVNGHSMTLENTAWMRQGQSRLRYCRICHREASQRTWERKRQRRLKAA